MNVTGPTLEHHLNPKTKDSWTMSRKLSDGHVHLEPLIKFIDFHNCILDDLHTLLRICDQFYKHLLLKFIRIDGNDGEDITKRKNLTTFLNFLEFKCKIKKPYYITNRRPELGKILFRPFSGNERMRIFSELYDCNSNNKNRKNKLPLLLNNLFPKGIDPPFDFEKEDSIWLGFYSMFNKLKTYDNNNTTIAGINASFEGWVKDYLSVSKKENNSEKLTPYIHIYIFHYTQMLELHGKIHNFSTQPNEKLNDFCTIYYNKCTNKQNQDRNYLIQLVRKRNRIEFYNLKGDVSEIYDDDDNNDA